MGLDIFRTSGRNAEKNSQATNTVFNSHPEEPVYKSGLEGYCIIL